MLFFLVAYVNFANISESCGAPEATSNSNAKPIVEFILTPAHENSEEVVQTKNEQNVCLAALQDSDDKFHNNANLDALTNHLNKQNFTNGHLMNGVAKPDINADISRKKEEMGDQNILENGHPLLPDTISTNAVLKLACSPVHVHDKPKKTIAVPVIDNYLKNEQNSNCIENVPVFETKDIELHDIVENGDNTIELVNGSDRLNFDDLPTIVETVENSSPSSKSLENNKGEHIFILFAVFLFRSYLVSLVNV